MNTKNKTGKFRIIFRFLKGNIRFFVGTLLFSVLFTACNALIPQIVKYTADHILVLDGIPDGLNVRQTLLLAALLVAASAVLSGVFNYLSKMCLAKGSENFLKSIRDTLYHHTQYLPFSWHVKHQTGEIIQRCTSDVEVIRNFVCRQLPEVFRICFLIVLYLGIMFSMNVQITLAAAAFFPVIIGYSCYFYSRIGKRFQDADEAEARSFAVTLVGMSVLTCMVTLAISTNVVISLGMVGALSIVRFRTAVKDPMDLLYLFWSITTGITTGAGMYLLALTAAVVMILMLLLFYHWQERGRVYIAVIHYTGQQAGDDIVRAFGRNKYVVKSKTMRGDTVEMVAEVFCKDKELEFSERLRAVPGVADVTLIQYNGEYHG